MSHLSVVPFDGAWQFMFFPLEAKASGFFLNRSVKTLREETLKLSANANRPFS